MNINSNVRWLIWGAVIALLFGSMGCQNWPWYKGDGGTTTPAASLQITIGFRGTQDVQCTSEPGLIGLTHNGAQAALPQTYSINNIGASDAPQCRTNVSFLALAPGTYEVVNKLTGASCTRSLAAGPNPMTIDTSFGAWSCT